MAKALYSAEDEVKDALLIQLNFWRNQDCKYNNRKRLRYILYIRKITGEFVVQCKKRMMWNCMLIFLL